MTDKDFDEMLAGLRKRALRHRRRDWRTRLSIAYVYFLLAWSAAISTYLTFKVIAS